MPEASAGGLAVSRPHPSGHAPDGRLGNRCGKEVGVRVRGDRGRGRGRSRVIGSIVPDRGIRQEWETRGRPGGTCREVECFPKAEIRAMGNGGSRLRPVQEGRLCPTRANRAGI